MSHHSGSFRPSSASGRRAALRSAIPIRDLSDVPRACLLTHPICQQDLRACRTSTEENPSTLFIIFSVLHLCLGLVIILCGVQSQTWTQRYDELCGFPDNETGNADFDFDLGSVVEGRFFIYYELDGFRQNHFRLRQSFSADQLLGKYVEKPAACDPLADLNGTTLFPCGLLPINFFSDYYSIDEEGGVFADTGIAWAKEPGNLYKPAVDPEKYPQEGRHLLQSAKLFPNETMNEHFMVWMRLAKSGHFRKLWAHSVSEKVGPIVHVAVQCNFPHSMFTGQRSLVLVKVGGLGGRNLFLGIANFGIAGMCLVFMLPFKIKTCNCVAASERLALPELEKVNENLVNV
jgi:hypothetical protein